jgi:4-hydroxyphenylpyruvate dioxygenase-like putative hemolysin
MDIARVDHIGLRVRDLDRALQFYEALGFTLVAKASNDAVAIVKNSADVEINLIYNANAGEPDENVLMDVDGHVSVFCRDPDRNVIELRGRAEDASELSAKPYEPEN